MLNGCGVSFWGDENVLELNGLVTQQWEWTKSFKILHFMWLSP